MLLLATRSRDVNIIILSSVLPIGVHRGMCVLLVRMTHNWHSSHLCQHWRTDKDTEFSWWDGSCWAAQSGQKNRSAKDGLVVPGDGLAA